MTDCNIPEEEERWCEEQRQKVKTYLAQAGLMHGEIGEWPAWHITPYLAIWAIESMQAPGWVAGEQDLAGILPAGNLLFEC